MKDIRPRQVIHTGFVFASGLALDLQIVPETLARKRIAGFQQLGSDAFQTGTVLILRFRAPALLSCAAALGAPLVRYGKLLSACPLTSGEISALETSEEAFVLVSGGTAALKPLCDCIPVDISQWLDASEFTILPALRPLGAVAMDEWTVHRLAGDPLRRLV